MTQNNLYMEDDNMRLYVDVQPLFIDELENSKNSAAASAQNAQQSAQNAAAWLNSIIGYKTNIELFYTQAVNSITNRLQEALSNIVDAKDAAVVSLHQVLSSIQATGQNIINQLNSISAQVSEDIDNNISADYLVQSNAMESGAISNKSNVLEYIKKYAHSTYCGDQASNVSPIDSKKFTYPNGHKPMITTDGIASGFSSSDYLQILNSVFSNIGSKTWKLEWEGILPSTQTSPYPYAIGTAYNTTNSFINCGRFNGGANWFFNVIVNDNGTAAAGSAKYLSTSSSEYGKPYSCYIEFTGTKYTMGLKTANRSDFATVDYESSNPIMPQSNDLLIGYAMQSGSIDLKTLKFTVAGDEVFSGNKTGIDTIKADNWTDNGTPSITSDGIISSTNSNYIISPVASLGNGFKFKTRFKITNYTGANDIIGATGSFIRLYANSLTKITCRLAASPSNITPMDGKTVPNMLNKWVDVEYTINNGTYTVTLTVEGSNSVTGTATSENTLTNNVFNTKLGNANAMSVLTDLNTTKFYNNGDLVYQPCLKIPYTESKTGSKIVNAVYRSRVFDMYEQFGFAPYYTLSDNNFTLPMGEIYGMIENLRKLVIERTS